MYGCYQSRPYSNTCIIKSNDVIISPFTSKRSFVTSIVYSMDSLNFTSTNVNTNSGNEISDKFWKVNDIELFEYFKTCRLKNNMYELLTLQISFFFKF